MKISEIILESPADLKLILKMMGFDLYQLKTKSARVKSQFKVYHLDQHRVAMKTYLSSLNSYLFEIAQLSQWDNWMKTEDGKMVMREIDKLYNDNIAFMKKHG